MFLEKIDWNNPRYKKWNLMNLGPLNDAQQAAFFDDDDIDFPDFSSAELKEIALKFPCRVELSHSNVCHGCERSWPRTMFKKSKFQDLSPRQKQILTRTMVRDGVKLYNKYVDEARLKQRLQRQTNRTLAEYYQERFLRYRFIRIRRLGDNVVCSDSDSDTDSDCSKLTVIDNTNLHLEDGIEIASNTDVSVEESTIIEPNSNVDENAEESQIGHQDVESTLEINGTCSNKTASSGVLTRSMQKAAVAAAWEAEKAAKLPKGMGKPSRSKRSISKRKPSNQRVSTMQTRQLQTRQLRNRRINLLHDRHRPDVHHVNTEINIIEHIDITTDSPNVSDDDDDDEILMIQETCTEKLSQHIDASSVDHSLSNDDDSVCNFTTQEINPDEFIRMESLDIRYMNESFNESVELFLSQANF